jgi:hypothetical protein
MLMQVKFGRENKMDQMSISREYKYQSKADLSQFNEVGKVFEAGSESISDKLDAFPKYASKQSIAKFLTKYEIFKRIKNINGSIVECGVLHGGGLLAWAKLSSILEPVNHTRRIIGFDTFEGFASLSEKDRNTGDSEHFCSGGLPGSSLEELEKVIKLYNLNRPLNHIEKVELVKGDIIKTAPEYIKNNPHLVVSLLYLDLVIYEPTKIALETFLPKMVKGSIIVFDELNAKTYPGETLAVDEVVGLKEIKIERFDFDSYVSFAVIE